MTSFLSSGWASNGNAKTFIEAGVKRISLGGIACAADPIAC
jgi:hypothetical protein